MQHIKLAVRFIFATLFVLGVLYPLAVYFVGNVMFPYQAQGSLLQRDGVVIGSELIGQRFTSAKYFHSRPSYAGDGYDAVQSGGSSLSLTSNQLQADIKTTYKAIQEEFDTKEAIPVDMVTASGSGLDPHISPESAKLQIARVAQARGVEPAKVEGLVKAFTQRRQYLIFGAKRVNVLKLNLALDERLKQ
jgi:K+-transporting ATPase ATPase C chain